MSLKNLYKRYSEDNKEEYDFYLSEFTNICHHPEFAQKILQNDSYDPYSSIFASYELLNQLKIVSNSIVQLSLPDYPQNTRVVKVFLTDFSFQTSTSYFFPELYFSFKTSRFPRVLNSNIMYFNIKPIEYGIIQEISQIILIPIFSNDERISSLPQSLIDEVITQYFSFERLIQTEECVSISCVYSRDVGCYGGGGVALRRCGGSEVSNLLLQFTAHIPDPPEGGWGLIDTSKGTTISLRSHPNFFSFTPPRIGVFSPNVQREAIMGWLADWACSCLSSLQPSTTTRDTPPPLLIKTPTLDLLFGFC